jgi:hypothetical protein
MTDWEAFKEMCDAMDEARSLREKVGQRRLFPSCPYCGRCPHCGRGPGMPHDTHKKRYVLL